MNTELDFKPGNLTSTDTRYKMNELAETSQL